MIPVIECKERIQTDEFVNVKLTVGKEIGHLNTTEHHIRWIRAFFVPDGGTFAYLRLLVECKESRILAPAIIS